MKRIVLFSTPTEGNIKQISGAIFPPEITNKVLAYMPSNGSKTKQVYTNYWKNITTQNGTKFTFVNNLLPSPSNEAEKITAANILLITGGNTFELLHNLRQSKLDHVIKEFAQNEEFVLAGFSAGAIILSPSIAVCNLPNFDVNSVGLTDLTGLGIVGFEIFPHYNESKDKAVLEKYRQTTKNPVREIINDGLIVLDL